MDERHWAAVDAYLVDKLLGDDPVLDAVLEANHAAGLPAMDVSPVQGKLLQLLARMAGARRVLEIGTLGGYSTIWLARALPADGHVVTLEAQPSHAAVAEANFARAGVAERIDLRVGPALETLPVLAREGGGPFDLVFIDADKENNLAYLDWALRLGRVGSVIVFDNVVRQSRVLDAASIDPSTQGVQRLFDQLARDSRLSATAIQTVGVKGWDGFALVRVEGL